jgi:hypothetical protein
VLLSALPFLAVYEASSLQISTLVESDGTGLRSVMVTANPEREKAVTSHLAELDPRAPWIVRQHGVVTEKFRLEQDARFTCPRPFADLSITRGTRFGLWPWAATTFTYSDKITRTDFSAEPKEQQGAAAAEFEYRVTMPGAIDESSVSPAGRVEGNTVTWKLKLDKPSLEVTAKSAQPQWMFTALVAYVLLAVIGLGLRFTVRRQRATPTKI